jgi:putative FmdB family regulatory protein
MPIYEYECSSCCNVFEVFQRMTEDPLTSCPDCSGPVKKLVSMSSFKLKGGGWYADGYASKSAGGSGSKPASSTGSSPAKAEMSSTTGSSDASSPAKSKSACTASSS